MHYLKSTADIFIEGSAYMKLTTFRFNKGNEYVCRITSGLVFALLLKSSINIHLTNEEKIVHNRFGLRTSDFGLRTSDFGLRTRHNYCLKSVQPHNFSQLSKPPPQKFRENNYACSWQKFSVLLPYSNLDFCTRKRWYS